jgi:hypothetical protein
MPRVRVIHWKAAEAEPLLEALRQAGVDPEYDGCESVPELDRAIRANPPDAIVIDLERRPSLGKSFAAWALTKKTLRGMPVVFVGGADGKVASIRETLPEAVFVPLRGLGAALLKALRGPRRVAMPVVVPHVVRTTAQKLGIDKGGVVGVIDAPRGYLAALGELPEETEVVEDPVESAATTLWFIHDPETFLAALRDMWTLAGRSKLWIIWRKGSTNGLTQLSIRDAMREAGLVDYKICSVNKDWSGMLFARKKA